MSTQDVKIVLKLDTREVTAGVPRVLQQLDGVQARLERLGRSGAGTMATTATALADRLGLGRLEASATGSGLLLPAGRVAFAPALAPAPAPAPAAPPARPVVPVLPELSPTRRGLESISTQLDRIQGQFGLIQRVAAGAFAVSGVVRAADDFANLGARVQLASRGLGNAAQAQAQLFQIAQDTRTPVAELATIYARLAGAGKELGLGQQQVIDTTALLGKAVALSGVSATSATAALVQLGQGLGSGVLRGEELNSVMEQTPRLAQALADGLGVPLSALRKLGETGQLTASKVFGALSNQRAVLEAEFAALPRTVGGALTQLGNAFLQTVGVFDQGAGLSAGAAAAIKTLADNMGEALIGATALGAGMLALRNSTVAAGAAAGAARLALGVLGGPIGAIATALGLAGAAWLAWKGAATDSEQAVARQVRESDAEILARIRGQIQALRERNALAASPPPEFSPEQRRAQEAGAVFARLQARRQAALDGQGEFAQTAPAARGQIAATLGRQMAEAYATYTEAAALAADQAAGQITADRAEFLKRFQGEGDKLADDLAAYDAKFKGRVSAAQRAQDLARIRTARPTAARGLADDSRADSAQAQAQRLQAEGELLAAGVQAVERRLQGLRESGTQSLAEQLAQRQALQAAALDQTLATLDQELRAETLRGQGARGAQAEGSRARLAELNARRVTAALEGQAQAERLAAEAAAERLAVEDAAGQRRLALLDQAAQASARLASETVVGRLQLDGKPAQAEVERTRQKVEDLRLASQDLLLRLRLEQNLSLDPARVAELQRQIDAVTAATGAAIALENDTLADRLKPGWQKLIDGWRDTGKLMQDSFDSALGRALQAGEDAFVQFATTGKLSVRGLVDSLLADLARLQFRKLAPGLLDSLGGFIGGLFNRGGSSPGAVNGSALNAGGVPVRASTGGLIHGPGSDTSDSIPARLSRGEFVVRAAAVRAVGVDTLARLNQADRRPLPGFATGGVVGGGLGLSPLRIRAAQAAGGPGTADRAAPAAAPVTVYQRVQVPEGVSRAEVAATVRRANAELLAELQRQKRRGGALAT